MNKEVIIDGVDVSGCEYYWNTHNLELCKINFDNNYYSNGLPLTEKCNDHKDCYYKQLKRLEQKLEKIKEIASKYSQREDYLLGGLFIDLVDELNEVLKDE